jgi:hypothetical protein
MAIRHLRFMPVAHSLVLVCLAASRRAAAVYRIEDADPKISSEDADIKVMVGGDQNMLLRAGQVLSAEQPSPIVPSGSAPDSSWTYWINDAYVLNFEKGFSPDDFVAKQDEILAARAAQASRFQFNPAAYPQDSDFALVPSSTTAGEERTEIFIVHGRSEQVETLAAEIEQTTGRGPIVLKDQPDRGSPTVIEKLERESQKAGFAVVILSADDEGRLLQADDPLKPRDPLMTTRMPKRHRGTGILHRSSRSRASESALRPSGRAAK